MKQIENLLEIDLLVDDKIVIETLCRMGICVKKKKILIPSCYLYENEGKYYLAHFKQLFLLTRDNAYNSVCEDDILRRNAIAFCLKKWKLINIDDSQIEPHDKYVFVLNHDEKKEWFINHKFNMRTLN
jgi:hypothetical protein